MSFDPIQHQLNVYISGLAQAGEAYHGAPPTPRVSVATVDMDASPYPTVVLKDCPTPAPTWRAYRVSTGQNLPTAAATAGPPYAITATVIYHQGHWGVSQTTPDTSRTCAV